MQEKKGKLIVARHGESTWNKAGLFTGSVDVGLTPEGFKMSEIMGSLIKDVSIDRIFTSMQVRAMETELCMMNNSGQYCPEVVHSSSLNERDYGDYTGTNKKEDEIKMGKEELQELRRDWDYPVPNGETLKMVYDRAVPFFKQEVLPVLNDGKNVLLVSHGNTIRSLIKYIENMSDEDIEKVEMPFLEIFIYDLDEEGRMLHKEIRKVEGKEKILSTNNQKSKVQIIATVGPASSKIEILNEMIRAGMDIARLNFSWATLDEHKRHIEILRDVAKNNNLHIPIIQDLPGPRIQGVDGHTHDENIVNALTEKDKEFIKFGVENNVDYIAMSFVGNKQDVIDCRNEILKNNGKQKVIAKIERVEAIKNLDEIISEADGVMIARGDLGNYVPLEQIPFIQKDIIEKCKIKGKPVITATQMLYSMKDNPAPTRAEATDVINAVLEGTDVVMLSEETANGKYPINAVYVMEHFLLEAEKHLKEPKFNSF